MAAVSSCAGEKCDSESSDVKSVNIPLTFSVDKLVSTGVDEDFPNGDRVRLDDSWKCTDFVDISEFVGLRYELAANRFVYSIAFFDENQAFISGKTTESILDFSMIVGHLAVPEGAKYAQFIQLVGSDWYSVSPENPFVEGFTKEEDYTDYKTRVLKHDGLKIVCLGDSLTEGNLGYYCHYLTYPYYLSKFLGCETVNHGVSGYTASDYWQMYSKRKMNVSDADFVLIMLGSNHGLTFNGNEHLLSYKNLVTEVKKNVKPSCRVVLITPTHATKNPKRVTYGWFRVVENAVDEVRKFAESSGFPLIDAFAESPIQSENEDTYQPVDGVHMSTAGYQALAKFLATRIEEMLQK